ncbi:MAG: metallophosphoesterase [Bacillales bacterium]|jgi:metallophosphoesterase (TIGR00282 family)|nr:metallophosphoesterase [Bacillales bacterium]
MKILFIGDIVASPGRSILKEYLPKLKSKYYPDVIIANAENASGGKGLNQKSYRELLDMGINIITMGNHTWDQKEIFDYIDEVDNITRPANFPQRTPGTGIVYKKIGSNILAVINLQGRTFLPAIDCPFTKVSEILEEAKKKTKFIFVDFHAEATSEKLALGWYLDGKVSAVVGTHTHVQTADERILPEGTAYISDVGMTGPLNGILGVEKEAVIKKFITGLPVRFEPATGSRQLSGVFIELDKNNGLAKNIKRIHINEMDNFFE